jgi:hypothetical protein
MEPRPEHRQRQGRRRNALLAVTLAATAAVTTTTSSCCGVHAFLVPALKLPAVARTRLATGGGGGGGGGGGAAAAVAGGGGRARGGLWASTTHEPEQQDAAAAAADDASAAASTTAAAAGKGFGAAPRAKTGTVNKRLMNVIDAELKVVQDGKGPEPGAESEDDTDLNGINPIQPLGSAVFAGFVSFLFWRITIGLATTLNNVRLETEWYPVKRIFSIASTAFVGITALGAGVIGVTALGLLGLAVRVTYGIATGELDPNKQKAVPPPSAVPLDAKGLPKVTGAWYDVPKAKQQPPQPPQEKEEGRK